MPPRLFSSVRLPRGRFPIDLALDDRAAQHVRVLRLERGDAITLFDGDLTKSEGEASGIIKLIDKRSVVVEMSVWRNVSRESPLDVALMQALAVGDKMDFTLQKAVELGATAFHPIRTARATLKLDSERAAKRHTHWEGIAIAACEQCGRNRLPQVAPIRDFAEALAVPRTKAILSPSATMSLAAWTQANANQPLAIFVGPEGGFTDAEVQQAERAGATAITLGPRVLRTETAGVAALALMQATAGDLG
jgi:16S rRNA (uracil1498-N3)-methyltransferase